MAKIEYGNGEVFLKTNGEIAAIDIKYQGKFKGVNTLGDGWHIKCNDKRIIIYSLAQTVIKERIFNYIGNIKIQSATCATWEKAKFNAQIISIEKTTWASSNSKWNVDSRKPETIFKNKVIHKEILKSRI